MQWSLLGAAGRGKWEVPALMGTEFYFQDKRVLKIANVFNTTKVYT